MNISNLMLEIPNPLLIKTDGLGDIFVPHWSAGTLSTVSKILKDDSLDSSQFVVKFVRFLARTPSNDIEISEKYENGELITEPDKLTSKDIEEISKCYIKKWKNEILYWVTYEQNRSEFNIDKTKSEPFSEYFYRILKISVKKSEEQSKAILKKLDFSDYTKKMLDAFNKNKFTIGALGERINTIQNLSDSDSTSEPQHTINDLSKNTALLKNLLEMAGVQSKQAVLLNEQNETLLFLSAKSLNSAKFSIWVAIVGILISILFSIFSIFTNKDAELMNKVVSIEEQNTGIQNNIKYNITSINQAIANSNKKLQNMQNTTYKMSHEIKKFSKNASSTIK